MGNCVIDRYVKLITNSVIVLVGTIGQIQLKVVAADVAPARPMIGSGELEVAPFVIDGPIDENGTLRLAYDGTAYDLLYGRKTAVVLFPVNASHQIRLVVNVSSVQSMFNPDTVPLVISHESSFPVMPEVLILRGYVEGSTASNAALALSRRGVMGSIQFVSERIDVVTDLQAISSTYMTSTAIVGSTVSNDVLVTNVYNRKRNQGQLQSPYHEAIAPRSNSFSYGTGNTVRKIQLNVDALCDYTAQFPSANDASDYLAMLYGLVEFTYRRDLAVELEITGWQIRTSTAHCQSACAAAANTSTVWNCLRSYWEGQATPQRDSTNVHATGWNGIPSFSGISFGSLCSVELGLFRSTVSPGTPPQPLPPMCPAETSLYHIGHELAHVLGARHPYETHNTGECLFVSASACDEKDCNIEECATYMGSGCGTCRLRFSTPEQEYIRCHFDEHFDCEEPVAITILGDYDHDGFLLPSDVNDCFMCASWPYEAMGCNEAFEEDSDGRVSFCTCEALYTEVTKEEHDCNMNDEPDGCEIDAEEEEDCNRNGIPDSCDILDEENQDCNNNSMPDRCETMSVTFSDAGPRYFKAVLPALCVDEYCIACDIVDSSPLGTCGTFYVQADGRLDTTPVFRTPDEWGTVYIKDDEIMPEGEHTYTFRLESIYESPGTGMLGLLSPDTWLWGDVNHSTSVNSSDVTCVTQAFSGNYSCSSLYGHDVAPAVPNGVINIDDILAVYSAYYMNPYGYTDPCD